LIGCVSAEIKSAKSKKSLFQAICGELGKDSGRREQRKTSNGTNWQDFGC
jgi:hypothetical protein